MAWNEPGNDGNGNDPWGGGRRGGDQGPPDIDEIIKNLSKKVNGLFGSGGPSGGGANQAPGNLSAGLLVGLVAVAAIIWGFMGFYVVDEAERGVVLRFGKVLEATVAPGLHWNPPIVDEVNLVNVSQLNAKTYENRAMDSYAEAMVRLSFVHDYHYFNELRMDTWIDCENEGRYLIGLDDANNLIPIKDGNHPHEIQLAELFIENLQTISCFPLYYDSLEPSRKRETVQNIFVIQEKGTWKKT